MFLKKNFAKSIAKHAYGKDSRSSQDRFAEVTKNINELMF